MQKSRGCCKCDNIYIDEWDNNPELCTDCWFVRVIEEVPTHIPNIQLDNYYLIKSRKRNHAKI